MNKISTFLVSLIFLLSVNLTIAQTRTVCTPPGSCDHPTLADAITWLPAVIPAGGVTFEVYAGHTEAGPLPAITATGTAANPIVFKKVNVGANPQITGGGAFGVRINGGAFITFTEIDVIGTQVLGYDLTGACESIAIEKCKIELAIGAGTGISASGANNCKFNGNTISKTRYGIRMTGNGTGNEIGVDEGNTITDFGGNNGQTATGVDVNGNTGYKIANNTIISIDNFYDLVPQPPTPQEIRGIRHQGSPNDSYEIFNNTITVTSVCTNTGLSGIEVTQGGSNGTGNIKIYNNTIKDLAVHTGTMPNIFGIRISARTASIKIYGNLLTGFRITSGNTMFGIWRNIGVVPPANPALVTEIYDNEISDFENLQVTGTGGIVCIQDEGGKETHLSNNVIKSIKINGDGNIKGYQNNSTFDVRPELVSLSGNQFRGFLSKGGVHGVYCNIWNLNDLLIEENRFDSLISLNKESAGIYVDNLIDVSSKIRRNKITNISSGGGFKTAGIWLQLSRNHEVSNNIIGNLYSLSSGDTMVNGIFLNGGTGPFNIFYNSIYLDASNPTATNFGVHGIGAFWYPQNLVLKNNLIINLSVPKGTGKATAIYWDDATPPSMQNQWSNNLYYCGTPGPNRPIYRDPTNTDQTITAYQTRVAPGESNSQTEDVLFESLNPQNAMDYLRPSKTVPTLVESGAVQISGITADHFSPIIRNPGNYPAVHPNGGGANPDIGAIEDDYKKTGNLDIGIASVVDPAPGSCGGPNETYSVELKNYSPVPLDFSNDPVTIKASMEDPSATLTIFPPVVVNTGTLAPFASLTVTIATGLNITAPGTFIFNAYSELVIDNNTSNDTLKPPYEFKIGQGTASIDKTSICDGDPVTLTLTGSSGTIQWEISTDNGATWLPATGPGSNSATYTTNPTVDTWFQAFVCGLNYTNTVSVSITPKPDVTIDPITDVSCYGKFTGSVPFTVNNLPVGTYTWTWDGAPSTSNPITGLGAGSTYELVVTATGAGCKETVSNIIVKEPNNYTISWVVTDVSCPGATDGAIVFSVKDATPDPVTSDYKFSIDGGSTWINNPAFTSLGAGWHLIRISDFNNCDTILDPIEIKGLSPISSSITAIPACEGLNNGQATVSASGGSGPYTYTWSTGATGSSVSNLAPGTYSVMVTGSNTTCPPGNASTTITEVIISLSATSTKASCEDNDQGSATAIATGGVTPLAYSWNSGAFEGENLTNLSEGTYDVTVTDDIGCQAKASTVVERDTVGQSAKFNYYIAGPSVKFTDETKNAISWYWDFGNGAFSNQQNPVQNFYPGSYKVNLLSKSDKGCWGMDSALVKIVDDLFIPNVFTPNGDGKNDWFHILLPEFEEISIEIFNRWGLLVWEITSSEIRWDGRTASGLLVPEGTYFYNFKAKGEGKQLDKNGFFQLLR